MTAIVKAGCALMRLAGAAVLIAATPASAALDLGRADVSRLANGLTVIVLEDRSFPVVSVQALYKSGSRDETAGKTGLAHFLEHLAFRASRNFPKAAATEAIYDAGGEWHGYTWLDQTTYFATMPKDGLDLLLRIEADRMAQVTIDSASIEAEKGAVITEMHGYENDPASVLLDSVIATALQAHPYRNNTIGLEPDVATLTLDDARDFYERHYVTANAVLAIVGDVDTAAAKALVARHFGALPRKAGPQRSRAMEPPQRGERRTLLNGPVDRQHFTIAFPAPAASNADYPAFLLLQQLVAGGSGANFNQNDWGTAARPGSLLHGVTDDIASWFIPTADRYLFTIKGSVAQELDRAALEREIERRLSRFRSQPPSPGQLAAAKAAVAAQLVADVDSTEEAAHQLAFFEGIGALDVVINLSDRIQAVTADEVRKAASAYLQPQSRTVGWLIPGPVQMRAALGTGAPRPAAERAGASAPAVRASFPELRKLSGGLPVIIQRSPLSDSATVQVLLSAPVEGEDAPADLPGLGLISRSGGAGELAGLIASARAASRRPIAATLPVSDPNAVLERSIASRMRVATPASPRVMLVVVSGAVDPEGAAILLEKGFGNEPPAPLDRREAATKRAELPAAIRLETAFPQGAIGYVVGAPPPGTRGALAWRMLLYILTHDYSGRLGRSAIGEKGLAYHIGSAYRTDGTRSWITITTGVDPDKAEAMVEELRVQLARLASQPPSDQEIEAARRHILGREISEAQSNQELADKLVRQFVETGGVRTYEQLVAQLGSVTRADILRSITPFAGGTILRVDVARQPAEALQVVR